MSWYLTNATATRFGATRQCLDKADATASASLVTDTYGGADPYYVRVSLYACDSAGAQSGSLYSSAIQTLTDLAVALRTFDVTIPAEVDIPANGGSVVLIEGSCAADMAGADSLAFFSPAESGECIPKGTWSLSVTCGNPAGVYDGEIRYGAGQSYGPRAIFGWQQFPYTVTPAFDTYLYQGAATYDAKAAASFYAGWLDTNAKEYRSVVESVLPALPTGVDFLSAVQRLYQYAEGAGGEATSVKVSRVLRDPGTGCCWNYYTGTTVWGTAGCSNTTSDYSTTDEVTVTSPAATGWHEFNVLAQVNAAKALGSIYVARLVTTDAYTENKHSIYRSADHTDANLRPQLVLDVAPPAAPTGFTATRNGTANDLAWTDNATNEESFELQYQLDGGSWTALASPAANAVAYSHTISALTWSTLGYRIRTNGTMNDGAWVESNVLTLATPTLSASANTYGAVVLTLAENGGPTSTGVKLFRATTSDGTYTEVVASRISATDNGTNWTVVDRRPLRGTPVIAYGATGYYKAQLTGAYGTTVLSAVASAAADVDMDAALDVRADQMHAYYAGIPNGHIDASLAATGYAVAYPGYTLATIAYAYLREIENADATAAANHLADFDLLWTYLSSATFIDADGIWELPDYKADYGRMLDHVGRMVWAMRESAVLFAKAGNSTWAATMRSAVDTMAQAMLTHFPLQTKTVGDTGLPGTTLNKLGNDANQPVWQASHAYVYGDVVKRTAAANGQQHLCTTAGTSDTTEPTWPASPLGTVADGTVVWTREQETFNYLAPRIEAATDTPLNTVFYTPNQHMWFSALLAMLYVDGQSALYQSAAALTVIEGSVKAACRYQLHAATDSNSSTGGTVSGLLPWDDGHLTDETTIYHNVLLLAFEIIHHALGDAWSARLVDVIDRAADYLAANWGVEPEIGWHLTAAAAIDRRGPAPLIMEKAGVAFGVDERVMWSRAYLDSLGETVGYTQYGTGETDGATDKYVGEWMIAASLRAALFVPAAPSSVVATPNGAQVDVTFTDNATNESGVRWKRSVDGGAYGSVTTIATPNTTGFTDASLPGSWSSLRYAVCAYNADGDSAYVESNIYYQLGVDSASTSVAADAVVLGQSHIIVVTDASVATAASPAVLVQRHVLLIAASQTATTADEVELSSAMATLAIDDATVAASAGEVALGRWGGLAVDAASVSPVFGSVTLDSRSQTQLLIDAAFAAIAADNVSLGQRHVIAIDSATVATGDNFSSVGTVAHVVPRLSGRTLSRAGISGRTSSLAGVTGTTVSEDSISGVTE